MDVHCSFGVSYAFLHIDVRYYRSNQTGKMATTPLEIYTSGILRSPMYGDMRGEATMLLF